MRLPLSALWQDCPDTVFSWLAAMTHEYGKCVNLFRGKKFFTDSYQKMMFALLITRLSIRKVPMAKKDYDNVLA